MTLDKFSNENVITLPNWWS